MADTYYCGIKQGKMGLIPGDNYDNRFNAGRINGVSHFNLSKEKRKNVECINCTSKDLIIEDPFILGIIQSEARKIEKINGVFVEFKKEGDKYKAVGIPLCNTCGSYLRFLERIYACDEKAPASLYAALRLATANDSTKQTLRWNIKRRDRTYDRELEALSRFIPENILNTLNDNLYLYHSEKQDLSLIHLLRIHDGNKEFEDAVLNGVITKIVKQYDDFIKWKNPKKAEGLKAIFGLAVSKKNFFAQWLMSRIVEIEEKVDNYRAEDIKPPEGEADWTTAYQEYQLKKHDWEIHEEIFKCLIQ